MPRYDYACLDCQDKLDRKLTPEEYNELVLFEAKHSMNPSDEELRNAMKCPRCNGNNCERSYINYDIITYTRGNGYLDKAGTRRDMNLYHLTQQDPYAEHREPGEVDHLKSKIHKAGQHDPKTIFSTGPK